MTSDEIERLTGGLSIKKVLASCFDKRTILSIVAFIQDTFMVDIYKLSMQVANIFFLYI